jgi:hypothetical protein
MHFIEKTIFIGPVSEYKSFCISVKSWFFIPQYNFCFWRFFVSAYPYFHLSFSFQYAASLPPLPSVCHWCGAGLDFSRNSIAESQDSHFFIVCSAHEHSRFFILFMFKEIWFFNSSIGVLSISLLQCGHLIFPIPFNMPGPALRRESQPRLRKKLYSGLCSKYLYSLCRLFSRAKRPFKLDIIERYCESAALESIHS